MSVIITNPVQGHPYLDDEDAAEALMDEQARERPISPRKQISERDKDKLSKLVSCSLRSLSPNYSLCSQVCSSFLRYLRECPPAKVSSLSEARRPPFRTFEFLYALFQAQWTRP